MKYVRSLLIRSNSSKQFYWGGLWLLLLLPSSSYAIPIVVTATGQVTYSYDSVNMLGFGSGTGTLVGASVEAIWSFDTDNAGPNLRDSIRSTYSPYTDWISSSVVLTNSTTTEIVGANGPVTSPTGFLDALTIANEDPRYSGSAVPTDLYYIFDYAEHDEGSGLQRYNSWGNVNSEINELFSTVTSDTTWIWDEVAGTTSVGGMYYYDNRTGDTNGDTFDVRYTFGSFSVTSGIPDESPIDEPPVQVPEPGTLPLLAIGMMGVLFARRYRLSTVKD